MDPRGRKNIPRAGDILRVNASGLPGIVSRGDDLSAAGGQFLQAGNDGMEFPGRKPRPRLALFSCLDDAYHVVSPLWALYLILGLLTMWGRWQMLGIPGLYQHT